MSQYGALQLAQDLLGRMGSGAEPAHVAQLFAENLEMEIAGDTGVLPWIGKMSGRGAMTDFITNIRAMVAVTALSLSSVMG